MKVKELVWALLSEDQEVDVVLDRPDGYDDVTKVDLVPADGTVEGRVVLL